MIESEVRDVRMRRAVERFRIAVFVLGCGLLFWQHDAAAVDWLFAAGIIASAALWKGGLPALDFAWPQPLLLLFLTITALATTLAGGSTRFFAITLYLAVLALALASALRRDPARIRMVETAIVIASCVAAITVAAGGLAGPLGWPFLQVFAWDSLRGEGLFKDPNVAGPFIACSYPLVAARVIRFPRHRLVLLVLATVLLGAGVLFSYSRLAMALWAMALAAVMLALAIARQRGLLLALVAWVVVAVGAVAGAAAVDRFPLYRYQVVQWYDAAGRFEGWRSGVEMVLDSPLGTGAGSFEGRTEEYFALAANRRELGQRGADESDNMLRNGAIDGLVGWMFDPARASAMSDPTSVTGKAVRMNTTDTYQGVGQVIPVAGGLTYSFAAQTRSDGTPALLIIHWLDENNAIIDQAGTSPATSTSWTEAQLLARTAPAAAQRVALFLTNLEPGEQYFAAARMVEGVTAPGWSSELQWTRSTERLAVRGLSAHNTYLRTAVESGLLGLLVFCAYWISLAWSAWRWGRGSWEWPVAFSLVLVAGLAIDTVHWRQLWVYTSVIAASVSAIRVPRQETRLRAHAPVSARSPSSS